MRKILLVGSRPLGCVEAVLQQEADVVIAGIPKHTIQFKESGVEKAVAVSDPGDIEQLLFSLAREGYSIYDFDIIAGPLEFGLVTASVLAKLVGAKALDLDVAVRLRDKYIQKCIVRNAGVKTAQCFPFERPSDLTKLIREQLPLPVVAKPPAGAGTSKTFKLLDHEDLRKWVEQDLTGPWLCESLIEGEEFHANGVVYQGKIVHFSLSKYFTNLLDSLHGGYRGSVILPADSFPELHKSVFALTQSALTALGHSDGVFHLEVFRNNSGEIYFGECAGRIPGGHIDRTIELVTGVNLHKNWASLILGGQPLEPEKSKFAVAAEIDLRTDPGLVVAIPSDEEILAQKGVFEVEIKRGVGKAMPPLKDTNARIGRAIVVGDSVAEVTENSIALSRWFDENCCTVPLESE